MKNLKCFKDWDAIDASQASVIIPPSVDSKVNDFIDKVVVLASNSGIETERNERKQIVFKTKNQICLFTNHRFVCVAVNNNTVDPNGILLQHSYLKWKDLSQFDIEIKTPKNGHSTFNIMLKFGHVERVFNIAFFLKDLEKIQQFLSSIQVNSVIE